MYTDGELTLISQIAAPGAAVRVTSGGLGLSVLTIEYGSGSARTSS
jgi:hypothetical protein